MLGWSRWIIQVRIHSFHSRSSLIDCSLCSVVGSQVASQACVPHQDVALVISLLSLWTAIGAAVGSAVAVGVWGHYMPLNLRAFIPQSVSDAQITEFFGDSKGTHQVM